ncbi:MAG: hypothetical protein V2B18_09000, partial [Pseudomonadota bacterium]
MAISPCDVEKRGLQDPQIINAIPAGDVHPLDGGQDLFISPALTNSMRFHMLGYHAARTERVGQFHVGGKTGQSRHIPRFFFNFVPERKKTLAHNMINLVGDRAFSLNRFYLIDLSRTTRFFILFSSRIKEEVEGTNQLLWRHKQYPFADQSAGYPNDAGAYPMPSISLVSF